jgi:hypothetical protein
MRKRARRPNLPFLDPDRQPRLAVSLSGAGPVAYRPGEAIVDLNRFDGGKDALDRILGLINDLEVRPGFRADEADRERAARSGFLRVRFDKRPNVVALAEQVNGALRIPGAVSPNTVLLIGSFTADPMTFASGFTADPMTFASAFGADPMTFANSSTARPAGDPSSPLARCEGPGRATVVILDTGVQDGNVIDGDVDLPCAAGALRDTPDLNVDAYLDIAAGHATFIHSIIERASPVAKILCEGVIHNDGDGDEVVIADALERVYDMLDDKVHLIVNLSFSGYYVDDREPPLIAYWIRRLVEDGAVVVAAAGNNGACRKKFPAAMPEVVSVGSIGPCGPSSFSNHGPWVEACAPGEDLISRFFGKFDGAYEAVVSGSVPDIDEFSGWAMWSGTSFSTPTVVGALAELIELYGCTAKQAVDMLIRRPGLFRIPDYGVVVNRVV